MSTHVTVIDYEMGNIWSMQNGLAAVGANSSIVGRPEQVAGFDQIILPGVGAFEDAMKLLRGSGLAAALTERLMLKKCST
jgi:glutamine amidotransferase